MTIIALVTASGFAWFAQFDASIVGLVNLHSVHRANLSSGLEKLEATVYSGGTRRGKLVVLYASLESIQPTLEINPQRAPVKAFLEDAIAVANAGYFTQEWRPTGLLIRKGQLLHPFIAQGGGAGSGVIVIRNHQVRLLEREMVTHDLLSKVDFAIQAGPRVIENDGRPGIHKDDRQRANRTILGYDMEGRLALAVVYGPDGGIGTGLTLFELQTLLGPNGLGKVSDSLRFNAALNLDGGPSTSLHLNHHQGQAINLPSIGPVASILRLEQKPN